MRKFLLFVSCISLIMFESFAATDRVSECSPVENAIIECGKGCYLAFDIGGGIVGNPGDASNCVLCPIGTYSDIDNAMAFTTPCKNCTKPIGANFLEDKYHVGYIADLCEWELSCSGGTYFYGDTVEDSYCAECGAHYRAKDNDSSCVVFGKGNASVETQSNGCTFNNICTGYVYKLKLDKNTNITELYIGDETVTYNDIITYAKFGSGFADQPDSSSWGRLNGFESISVKQLKGYSQNANCSGSVLMPSHVQTSPDKWNWNDIFDFFPDAPNENGEIDVTLYACWNNSQITVRYYTDTAGTLYTDGYCGPINDKEDSFECKVEDVQNSGSGVLQGYKCTYVSSSSELPCVSNDPNRLFRVDDAIPLVSTQIILRPQFAPCPAGYYCSNGKSYECPLGTTSTEGGADEVSDCYMMLGKDGTNFCDNNGCFYLPGNGKIIYNPLMTL